MIKVNSKNIITASPTKLAATPKKKRRKGGTKTEKINPKSLEKK
jgi:hypothetical protein